MIVYALGALPGDVQIVTLRTALQDSAPDVRWNAAVALARHGSHEGVGVLRQMLDRARASASGAALSWTRGGGAPRCEESPPRA